MRRFTDDEIKRKAITHVAYGWAKSPGTHSRDIVWTPEDTEKYNKYFDEGYRKVKSLTPPRQSFDM